MNIDMVSTRDASRTIVTYADALLSGLAPDGGLYVPTHYPMVSKDELMALRDAKYTDVARVVKGKFTVGVFSDDDVERLVTRAYTEDKFPAQDGNITPVAPIGDDIYVQNLSLGPTASFKDMALQLLGEEMNFELQRRNEKLVVLGATSGDTGSAAEAAVKGLENIQLFMLSPESGMSDFQKAQMGALTGDNVYNISVRGRFDDCQDLVKEVKKDAEFAKLGAVNSINWGRITSQVPYYFAGYLQVADNVGDEVDFVVPSGNFGNMLSGYIAKRMGLPIRRLIVATNENNVLDKLFKTGVYEQTPSQVTSSPSMDISKASNYERLVYDLFEGDAERVAKYMQEFSEKGSVALKDYDVSTKAFEKFDFLSSSSTHSDRMKAIKKTYDASEFVIDPHTADAVSVAYAAKEDDGVPMICMGTALPVKFEDTIQEALGFVPERPERFASLEEGEGGFDTIDVDVDQLASFIRERILQG